MLAPLLVSQPLARGAARARSCDFSVLSADHRSSPAQSCCTDAGTLRPRVPLALRPLKCGKGLNGRRGIRSSLRERSPGALGGGSQTLCCLIGKSGSGLLPGIDRDRALGLNADRALRRHIAHALPSLDPRDGRGRKKRGVTPGGRRGRSLRRRFLRRRAPPRRGGVVSTSETERELRQEDERASKGDDDDEDDSEVDDGRPPSDRRSAPDWLHRRRAY